jgi:hypothetical protein
VFFHELFLPEEGLPTTNFVIGFNESIEDTDLTCYLLFKPIKNNSPSALVPVDKMEG